MAILEGRNLRKTYHLGRGNKVEALKSVDISIEAGEMVAIMGPSGSGKSTLMHILGLLHGPDLRCPNPADPCPAPELYLAGENVSAVSDNERTRIRARRMGFVFQDFNLVPDPHGPRERDAGLRLRRHQGQGRPQTAALEALGLVGLADRADHKPAELSGGEQQRVAIARALVNKPALVLADEPTGNLDSERSAEVLALMREFNREHGQTIVLVTHDAEVGAACDRVVRMRDGHIRDHGLRAGMPVMAPVAVAATA